MQSHDQRFKIKENTYIKKKNNHTKQQYQGCPLAKTVLATRVPKRFQWRQWN